MANAITGNKIFVDATGEVTTARTLVTAIIFTPDASNDQLVLRETASGTNCLKLSGATAKQSLQFDFSSCPLLFGNGIYVQTITSGATATLVTTQAGK